MSRRSRLGTVLRVAELREVQARRDLLAAHAARAAAAAAHAHTLARLAAGEAPSGDGPALQHAAQVRALRLVAVGDAAAESRQADAAHAVAHDGWVASARHAHLVETLIARRRAEAEAERERAEQRELDERAGGAGRWSADKTQGAPR